MLSGGRLFDQDLLVAYEELPVVGVVVVLHAGFATVADELGKHAIEKVNTAVFEILESVDAMEPSSASLCGFVGFVIDSAEMDGVVHEVRTRAEGLALEYLGHRIEVDLSYGASPANAEGLASAIYVAVAEAWSDFESRYSSKHEAPPFEVHFD